MYLSVTQLPTGAQAKPAVRRHFEPRQKNASLTIQTPAPTSAPAFSYSGPDSLFPSAAPGPGQTDRPLLIPPPTQLGQPHGIPKARSFAWVAGIVGAAAIVFVVGFGMWLKKGRPALLTQRRLSADDIPFLPLRDADEDVGSSTADQQSYPSRPATLRSSNSYRLARTNRWSNPPPHRPEDPA